MFYGD